VRRRLPSPALVIASIALFLALTGAGVAASLAIIHSPHPTTLVSASVSSDGNVTGARITGGRESIGVYTLTIIGNTFAPNKTFAPGQTTVSPLVIDDTAGAPRIPPACDVASKNIARNGSATADVDCFTYAASTGWVPTDAAFNFLMLGPSR
jgi:hypothetical protein